jgi:predicted nucleotidyltransferase
MSNSALTNQPPCFTVMYMTKTTPVVRKKSSLKPPTARKRAAPPFADKIPFIRSLILDSVKQGTIKKIYLVGSYAYGRPTKKSDIDLCVIIGNNLDRSHEYLKIARNLFLHDIIPADVLVYNEKIFYDYKNPNGIENTIITKGKILYE